VSDLIRQSTLANGLRVVTESIPSAYAMTVGFWVDAGSRDESGPLAGASHFLEHLLFKGTETRTARDIAEAVEAAGGEMNAFTGKEYTAFYVRVLREELDLALDILSDIMWAPSFESNEMESERQVIIEEILMHNDEPSDIVHDLFTEALYPGHPLGREILGDKSTIAAMTRDQVRGYFTEHYRPSAIVVAVAGDLDHDKVAAGLERRCPAVPGQRPLRSIHALAPTSPLVVSSRPTEQAHVVVGMRALARDDEDRYALAVLNDILGGGMSSRLFQEIREKRGLVYSVYSYGAAYVESGSLAVYAGTSPSQAHQVISLIGDELDRLAGGSVTDREMAVAKGHVKGALALSLEDSASRMGRIGRAALVHGRVRTFEEVVARSEAVGPADIRRVAERVLVNERVMAVVGPFEEGEFAERVA